VLAVPAGFRHRAVRIHRFSKCFWPQTMGRPVARNELTETLFGQEAAEVCAQIFRPNEYGENGATWTWDSAVCNSMSNLRLLSWKRKKGSFALCGKFKRTFYNSCSFPIGFVEPSWSNATCSIQDTDIFEASLRCLSDAGNWPLSQRFSCRRISCHKRISAYEGYFDDP